MGDLWRWKGKNNSKKRGENGVSNILCVRKNAVFICVKTGKSVGMPIEKKSVFYK